jgi:hypothetical protein
MSSCSVTKTVHGLKYCTALRLEMTLLILYIQYCIILFTFLITRLKSVYCKDSFLVWTDQHPASKYGPTNGLEGVRGRTQCLKNAVTKFNGKLFGCELLLQIHIE